MSQLSQAQTLTITIGLVSLLLLWLGEKFLPSRPIALFVVIISIVFISITNLATRNGRDVKVRHWRGRIGDRPRARVSAKSVIEIVRAQPGSVGPRQPKARLSR